MEFRFAELDPRSRYKLLTGTIVPRPIAWVNTLNSDGGCNTAPFSFFNAVSDEPPAVMFSVGPKPGGGEKDTVVNLRRHAEFVVHLCNEDTIEALSFTSGDFPPGFQEATAYGLTLVPSTTVSVPRIQEAPIAFECRLHQLQTLGSHTVVIGVVELLHIDDELLTGEDKIDFFKYRPVGRLAGEGYAYIRDLFALSRAVYARYRENPEAEKERIKIRPYNTTN